MLGTLLGMVLGASEGTIDGESDFSVAENTSGAEVADAIAVALEGEAVRAAIGALEG